MNERPETIRHVAITGRVQRVGFRAWAEDMARWHGVSGWVRNRRDGSVEAVFAGAPVPVAAMINDCHRGPPGAWVDAIDEHEGRVEDLALRNPGEPFSVLPTA